MPTSASPQFEHLEALHDSRRTRVYRARRREDQQSVILKIVGDATDDSTALLCHRREYQLLRNLEAVPGIIRAFDLLDINGSLAMVCEDIGGDSLDHLLLQFRPGLQQALELAIGITRALGHLHRARVMHKNLNPGNLIWNRQSGEIRLIGFSIASQLAQETQPFLAPPQLEGTLAYIAPEQTGRINRQLDYRADLYSLGVTLYEVFVGEHPFAGLNGIELMHAHLAQAVPPPHQIQARIPPMLGKIILRLLEKGADDRYQSADGALHDLQLCLSAYRSLGNIPEFMLSEGDAPTHFQLPQKLYGREPEVASILAACERAADGQASLLLVAGPPGVGKSALVREVYPALTRRNGNFIVGKFDQYQRDTPFSAWRQAFQELSNRLLQEDETRLASWRQRILAGVGTLGRVLTDIVPSIELIIGPQPEVPLLDGEKAQNRLSYVFGNFIRTLCRPEHPLVVFIDDWQWADAGSLALLRFVMGGGAQHLLLIGAYRDSEIDSAHPFRAALTAVARAGCPVETLRLDNLRRDAVAALVHEALGGDTGDCAGLDRLLFEKTRGNAFFLTQLLSDLHERGAVRFNRNRRCWQYDREQLQATEIAGNVVDLLGQRIQALPAATRHSIVLAACIGDRFRLDTLAALCQQPAHLLAAELEAALREGILLPVGSAYRYARQQENTVPVIYQFVHDRVRQAAYNLLPLAAREATHLAIAQHWLTNPQSGEGSIFEIANQFNASGALTNAADIRQQRRQINTEAAARARQAADHATALSYYRQALAGVVPSTSSTATADPQIPWLAAADSALLCKAYGDMEQWLLAFQPTTAEQQIAASKIRLRALVAQNRLEDALQEGLTALRLLGITIERHPGKLRTFLNLQHTRLLVRGKSFTELHALPAMNDASALQTMELLALLLPAAYWTDTDLLVQVICRMVRLTLQAGHSPNAGYGLSWWGIIECARLGHIDSGQVFGDFAIELARKHGLRLQYPLYFVGSSILKYKHPLRKTLPLLQQSYALALEKGDFECAAFARSDEMQTRFHCGTPLPELLPEMFAAHRELLRFQMSSSTYWHAIGWQTAQNLVAGGDQANDLLGPAYDEKESLAQHVTVNDHSTLFLLYAAKTMLSVYFDHCHHDLDYAREARARFAAGLGMYAQGVFIFHEALLLTRTANLTLTTARHSLATSLRTLARLAEHAPSSYRHRWTLVEAERLHLRGRHEQALIRYEEAADLARVHGFIHEEALALELTARFHRRRQRPRLAAHCLRLAIQTYEAWGAQGKAQRLRRQFPLELLSLPSTEPRPMPPPPRAHEHPLEQHFDLEAASAASQAIAGEILLPALTRTLLQIAIQNSGAQRATLILNHSDGLHIEAIGHAQQALDIALLSRPLDSASDLPVPRTLLQYVSRTQQAVVIDDARERSVFSHDPYFQRAHPLSLLCEPIVRQGKLLGLLYLENSLTVGTFSPNRRGLLRLLAAQAAISLENAQLYSRLEEKVEARTAELRHALLTQEQLNSELQAAHARLHAANDKLEELANTDGLTGLANRRHLGERMQQEITRCAGAALPLAVLLCDLDHFKRYNDLYGHVRGDECLRQIAEQLRELFTGEYDVVARYGGEEFVILLPGMPLAEARQAGERLRQAIATLGIPHAGNGAHGHVTLSVGCHAQQVYPDSRIPSFLERADRALYAAKAQGRNRVVVLGESLPPRPSLSEASESL